MFLFDLNEKLLHMLLNLLKIKATINYTESYEPGYLVMKDYRQSISSKKESAFPQKPYYQLFEDRHGFLKNLSIVDLLFNQGPQSINYL